METTKQNSSSATRPAAHVCRSLPPFLSPSLTSPSFPHPLLSLECYISDKDRKVVTATARMESDHLMCVTKVIVGVPVSDQAVKSGLVLLSKVDPATLGEDRLAAFDDWTLETYRAADHETKQVWVNVYTACTCVYCQVICHPCLSLSCQFPLPPSLPSQLSSLLPLTPSLLSSHPSALFPLLLHSPLPLLTPSYLPTHCSLFPSSAPLSSLLPLLILFAHTDTLLSSHVYSLSLPLPLPLL